VPLLSGVRCEGSCGCPIEVENSSRGLAGELQLMEGNRAGVGLFSRREKDLSLLHVVRDPPLRVVVSK
jgi:hypothetical protein